MATCGNCIYYVHKFFYDWSTSGEPFITSMTECEMSSDGYILRGYNCVPCANYVSKPSIPFFNPDEVIGEQLSLF